MGRSPDTVETPARITQAVAESVARHLEAELGNRGLLLRADVLAEAQADAAQLGARLRNSVLRRCYPDFRTGDSALAIEFESDQVAARFDSALAFGAATARVLLPNACDQKKDSETIELVCAIFNLGIGLVDGLCDEDRDAGGEFLEILRGLNVARAAEEPRARGWLHGALPPQLAENAAAAFSVEVIETFFHALHDMYPGDSRLALRCHVGGLLNDALEAERQSVVRTDCRTRQELIELSRLTSVLPFLIIETIAAGRRASDEPTAGTRLGEAMWLIDDLVDLCQDARSGSLNAILLAVAPGEERGPNERLAALERLLASKTIGSAAADAAERLLAGLHRGGPSSDSAERQLCTASFLQYVHAYAGISPMAADQRAALSASAASIASSSSVSSTLRSTSGGM
ncbi:MAG TPA: hypothetical protein VGQ52_19045 [Gemmatimonadaceae bacterium]|jgi:hypothetical protein|nr:hypothetical protein [Gemmatimonadaceae bacterium]